MALSSLEKQVLSAVEARRAAHVDYLRSLIRIDSTTGKEGEGQRAILRKFQEMGLRVEEFVPQLEALKDHPEYLPPMEGFGNYQGRPNVIGTLKGIGGERSLLLFAHIDTVPEGVREDWHHDPFGGEVEGGRMYGRGTQDMKGGLAAVILAIDTLIQLGVRLKGDVLLMSNIEEEIGGSGGILACVLEGYRADACIYPHPGWGKPAALQVASSGVLAFRVRVRGRAVHGYLAHHGVNAIEKAMKVAAALKALDDHRAVHLRSELTERFFSLGGMVPRASNLYVTAMRGGEWIYQVPSVCELDGMMTYPPSEEEAAVRRVIEETVRQAGEADPFLKDHPPELQWLPFRFSSSTMALDEPIISVVAESMEEVLGVSPTLTGNPVGSDTRVTVRYGKMPTVNIGPLGGGGHSPDEWVDLESYHQTIQFVALSILRWCGVKA